MALPQPQPQQQLLVLDTLTTLPPEVLLNIFKYLEIPDLLQTSRTCHQLRTLACDPLLHLTRLHSASQTLSYLLARRASKSSISPPSSWIWMSKTNVLSRQISKSLIRIRLSHNLEHRPSPAELVERAILPPACCSSYSSPVSPALIQSHQAVQRRSLRDRLARKLQRRPSVASLVSLNIIPAECVRACSSPSPCTSCASRSTFSSPVSSFPTPHSQPSASHPHHHHHHYSNGDISASIVVVSPAIVATRRNVIRETLKDGLRAWVEGRGIQAQKRKADELEATERANVKNLVRRFAARKLAADAESDFGERRRDGGRGAVEDGGNANGNGVGVAGRVSERRRRGSPQSAPPPRCWGREAEIARNREEERRKRMGDAGRAADGGLDYCGVCPQPTRAHVLGLKRFWEGVIRAAAAG
jgi:hypothetical protein